MTASISLLSQPCLSFVQPTTLQSLHRHHSTHLLPNTSKCPLHTIPSQLPTYYRLLVRPLHDTNNYCHTQACRSTPTPSVGPTATHTNDVSTPAPTPQVSTTRQILGLALPALGALALDPLLSLIDTAFVGRLGVGPIAGVSLATLLLNVSFSLFNFLCISITPIVANAMYESPDSPSAASQPISIALCLAAILGTVTGLVLFIFAKPLAIALSATPEVLPFAMMYLRARAIAIPLALMSFVANGAMRAFRDLRTPFLVAVIANAANISLDILLMFYFRLGVLGAALATSASQAIGFTLMVGHLFAKKRILLSDIIRVFRRPPMKEIRPMMSAGVLLAVRTCSMLSAVAYATKSAAALGEVSLAAFELCRQLWVFNSTMLDSLATAAQALVASAMASRMIKQARNIAKQSVYLSMIAAIMFSMFAVLMGSRLPGLFTRSEDVRTLAMDCIRIAAVCAPVNGAVFAMDGVLAACADYRYLAGGIALAAACACVAITCVRTFNGGVVGLWGALNVLMISRAVVLFARFCSRHGPMAIKDQSH